MLSRLYLSRPSSATLATLLVFEAGEGEARRDAALVGAGAALW